MPGLSTLLFVKAYPAELFDDLFSRPVAGRLSTIQTEGLPETTLRQLQSRLPVHLGDEITTDTLRRIEQALQTVDPRLKIKLEGGDRGDVALAVVMDGENK